MSPSQDAWFSAIYTDGQTAKQHEVVVRYHDLFLSFAVEGHAIQWPYRHLEVEAMGRSTLVLGPEDQQLTIYGVDELERLKPLVRRSVGLPITRHRFRTGAMLLASFIAIAWLSWEAAEPLSKFLARQVPLSTERSLLGFTNSRLEPYACEDAAANEALSQLSAALYSESDYPLQLSILHTPLENAFALPGGQIYITSGLIETAESSEEIAGVIAHEIGHIHYRHVLAQIIESTLLISAWAFATGDAGGVLLVDPATAIELARLQHSRSAELEADAFAAQRLTAAGYGTQGLQDFFSRHTTFESEEAGGEVLQLFSTHPASAERVAVLAEMDTSPALHPLGDEILPILQGACEHTEELPISVLAML